MTTKKTKHTQKFTSFSEMMMIAKLKKAEALFEENIQAYGSISHVLRAMDCTSKDEAINMLAIVQKVSIFKINGRVVVE